MSDAELFIRCDCHSPDHMLIFDVWHWDNERPQNSTLSVHYDLDPALSWWNRARYALQFALTGKTQKWWWADTIIKDADAARLHDFLSDYLGKSLNASAIEAAAAGETRSGSTEGESAVGAAETPSPHDQNTREASDEC